MDRAKLIFKITEQENNYNKQLLWVVASVSNSVYLPVSK